MTSQDRTTGRKISHIISKAAWERARAAGIYQPESLVREGFIHCSRPEQVVATANRFYRGQRDLLLLIIECDRVTAEVRDDFVAAENQTFPHIWGPLDLDAIVGVVPFVPDADGKFEGLPAELL